MNDGVLKRFDRLTMWSKAGQRAPHKPLMLLIALGRLQNGVRKFSFEQIEDQLADLLVKYGPRRTVCKPDEPFWRLGRQEQIFSLTNEEKCRVHRDGGTNRSDLIRNKVTASFDSQILQYFDEHPPEIPKVALNLIHSHFQPNFVEDLFAEVGLEVTKNDNSNQRRRDPTFRNRVLRAYEERCAVCGFHMVLTQRSIGVEAAHIMWHNAGGPDLESNGIALCTLHHKLFDYGVFQVEPSTFIIKLSDSVSCFNSAESYVRSFHDKKISLPRNRRFAPAERFLDWHKREIFKGRADV